MPQSTPNQARLELIRDRVGKEPEATESATSPPLPLPSVSPPVDPQPIQETAQETQQLPALPYPSRGLGQPSFHDRRSKVPYNRRYRKENVMLDERLVPYIYHWMETHGMNKTDAVNRAWLKVLLADGYQIDPNILDRPFRPEDLPRQPLPEDL